MQWRNPRFTADGRIDVELNHPVYGWVPFTAQPDDPEPIGREIFAAASEGPVAPYVPPVPTVPPYVRKLSLVRVLRSVGLDGQPAASPEASAWNAFRAALALQPEDVQEDWALAVEVPRDFPALVEGAEVLCPPGQASAILDAVFIQAGAL